MTLPVAKWIVSFVSGELVVIHYICHLSENKNFKKNNNKERVFICNRKPYFWIDCTCLVSIAHQRSCIQLGFGLRSQICSWWRISLFWIQKYQSLFDSATVQLRLGLKLGCKPPRGAPCRVSLPNLVNTSIPFLSSNKTAEFDGFLFCCCRHWGEDVMAEDFGWWGVRLKKQWPFSLRRSSTWSRMTAPTTWFPFPTWLAALSRKSSSTTRCMLWA